MTKLFVQRVRNQSWVLFIGLAVGFACLIPSASLAEVTGPSAQDRNVTSIVMSMMRSQHVSHHPLDDEISKRSWELYLKTFDPRRTFFYQSDIDEFKEFELKLDDMLKSRDTSFAYLVYERYMKRMAERVGWVDELVQDEFDYSRKEYLDTDFDKRAYPKNESEAKERWRKRIKYDLLFLEVTEKKKAKEARDQIKRRYHNIQRRWGQFDNHELLEMFLTAVTSAFDPHTSYMSPTTLENFRIQLGLRLEGIGAQLSDEDGYAVITKIILGGAADKHGKLKADDRVVTVGEGEDGEMVDIVGMKLNDAVKLIRGQAGTIVRLGVVPEGGGDRQILSITRARIELADSAAKGKVFDVEHHAGGAPIQIGVIDLPSFYLDMEGARNREANFRSTTVDVRKILDEFNGKGVDVVVLDLRSNGGGSLTEAVNLTGLFIDTGPVVQIKDAANRIESLDDDDEGSAWDGPLVVLTSMLSASASEILAGAIQDYDRGIIVGDERTHGKGTVQTLQDLDAWLLGRARRRPPQLGALKITTAQFYRPLGDSTQRKGVEADVVLPSVTSHMDISEADLDYAIEFDKVPGTEFTPSKMVGQETVKKLVAQSKERRKSSEKFAKLDRRIKHYLEQKEKNNIALNRKEYEEVRKEFDAEKEEEKEIEKQIQSNDTIQRDYMLDEIFQVAADYWKELEKQELARRR